MDLCFVICELSFGFFSVGITRHASGRKKDEFVHSLGVLESVSHAEIGAKGVADNRHRFETHFCAPLFQSVDEERLGFCDAGRDIIFLGLDSEWDTRGTAHAQPVDSIHGGATISRPVGEWR